MTTSTVIQYGVQYVPGGRPEGTFGSYWAAVGYLEEHPAPQAADHYPMVVERVILTGDWRPAVNYHTQEETR